MPHFNNDYEWKTFQKHFGDTLDAQGGKVISHDGSNMKSGRENQLVIGFTFSCGLH